MYAVVKTGGKQYRVSPEDVLKVEQIDGEIGSELNIEEVLMVSDEGGIKIGKPFIDGAVVNATILEQGKHKKIDVMKYKRRKRYRRTIGHRQNFTKIKVNRITVNES